MTDESGNVIWRAEYKPFGEEFEVTPDPENKKMFVGKEMDKETGLYYFGARYMEPMIGRFVSPDPVGAVDPNTGKINQIIIHDPQRINSYVYGLNNPHKYIDADGEEAVAITVGVVITVYGPLIVTGIKAAVITLVGVGAAKATVEAYNASKSESRGESITAGKASEIKKSLDKGQQTEHTPKTHPKEFDPVRGSSAKRHKESGEIWVEDKSRHGGEHYEVYRNRKDWEKRKRDRDVHKDGREKRKF
jgi:RHS repeat-associated protein